MSKEIAYRIDVKGARDVMPMDPNGQSDPYAKIGLADRETGEFINPSSVLRSKTHYVTLFPVWKGFHMIAKSTEHKIRVEIWDKDQSNDDFEGMVILDLNSLEGTHQEMWLPLVGRKPDEKVTGDVNITLLKGPLCELESHSLSRSNSTVTPPAAAKEDEKAIKKLHQDLKTKSGKLEIMKENNTVLDQQLVKAKQQVEQLQAELAQKNLQMETQEVEMAKVKTHAAELRQALQEKQNVSQMVKEWNDKGTEIKKLQSDLRAKFQGHKKGISQEEQLLEESDVQLLSVDTIMEQWTQYSTLIDSLEVDLRAKKDELQDKERQLKEANLQIAILGEETTLRFEEKEVELNAAIQKIQKLEKNEADQLDENIKLKNKLHQLQEQMQEAEKRRAETEQRYTESERKREEAEQKLEQETKKTEEAESRHIESEKRRQEEETKREEAETKCKEAESARQEAEHLREEELLRKEDAELSRSEAEKKKEEAEANLKDAAASFNRMQAEMKERLEEIENNAHQLKNSTEQSAESIMLIKLADKEEQLRIEIQARETLELTLQKQQEEQRESKKIELQSVELQLEVKIKEEELLKMKEVNAELEKQHAIDEETILSLKAKSNEAVQGEANEKGEDSEIVQKLRSELLEKSHQLQQVMNSEQKARSELLSIEVTNAQLLADKTSLQTKVEQLQAQQISLTDSTTSLSSSTEDSLSKVSLSAFFRPPDVQRYDSTEDMVIMKKTTKGQQREKEEELKSGNAQFQSRSSRTELESSSSITLPQSSETREKNKGVEMSLAELENISLSKWPELPRSHDATPIKIKEEKDKEIVKKNRGFCFAIFGKKEQ